MSNELRDADIRRAVEARRADDTKIMQKVNAVNREAFLIKFPGMLEHSMRLVNERLMHCLNKPEGIVLGDPMSWPANPQEIASLAQALKNLNDIHQQWHTDTVQD